LGVCDCTLEENREMKTRFDFEEVKWKTLKKLRIIIEPEQHNIQSKICKKVKDLKKIET